MDFEQWKESIRPQFIKDFGFEEEGKALNHFYYIVFDGKLFYRVTANELKGLSPKRFRLLEDQHEEDGSLRYYCCTRHNYGYLVRGHS